MLRRDSVASARSEGTPAVLVVGFPAGSFATNCYLIATGPGEPCVVVDPGIDAMPGVLEAVEEHWLAPVAVLLTHGHIDHTWSVVPVCGRYGVPAWIHADDHYRLEDAAAGSSPQIRAMIESMTGGAMPVTEPDDVRLLGDGQALEVAGLSFTVDHSPGHTEGSVMFRREADGDLPPVVLSGDTLFAGSIGRTDLPGGDHGAMLESLRRKVLPLDDETVVLPGHGETTTIGRERATNPYLRALLDTESAVTGDNSARNSPTTTDSGKRRGL